MSSPVHARRPVLVLAVTDDLTARHLMRGQPAFLARADFDVHLVAGGHRGLDDVAERESVRCSRLPLRREIRPAHDLLALWHLFALFRRLRPAIVCAGTPKAGLLGMLAARMARVPRRVYHLRGLRLETQTGFKRMLLYRTEQVAAACAHVVVCVSPSLRSAAVDLGVVPQDKAVVLADGSSNGVDTTRFRPAADASDRRLSDRPPTIGFVGRLVHDKGIADLARAFEHVVLPEIPDAKLLVLGEYEAGDPVPADVRRFLDGHPQVDLEGFVDDSSLWYPQMDVVAFPSYREGFPNVPLEAAACGLPVAGYGATGTVDAVVDGATGTLVPVGQWRALGEALCAYLRDSDLRRQHGESGCARVRERFPQERVWRAWREFFLSLLDDHCSQAAQ